MTVEDKRMSGRYSGLKAFLKKENEEAFGHYFNLVGECSVNDNISQTFLILLLLNGIYCSEKMENLPVYHNSVVKKNRCCQCSCK